MDILLLAILIVIANRLVIEVASADWVPIAVALWIPLAYFVALESLWGTTLGKRLAKLRVVNETGGAPSVGQVAVRTFFRLLEVNPFLFGGLPAGVVAYYSRYHQRLGDILAHTYVLGIDDLKRAAVTP